MDTIHAVTCTVHTNMNTSLCSTDHTQLQCSMNGCMIHLLSGPPLTWQLRSGTRALLSYNAHTLPRKLNNWKLRPCHTSTPHPLHTDVNSAVSRIYTVLMYCTVFHLIWWWIIQYFCWSSVIYLNAESFSIYMYFFVIFSNTSIPIQ